LFSNDQIIVLPKRKKMFDNLRIENFRSIESIRIRDLGAVNLIVGENNGGKSTFLEAIRVFCAKGDPILLNEIAAARGEVTFDSRDIAADLLGLEIFESMFAGRRFNDLGKNEIYIGDINEETYLTIERAWISETVVNAESDESEIPTIRRQYISSPASFERSVERGRPLEPILLIKNKIQNGRIRRSFVNLDDLPSDSTAASARRLSERWTQNFDVVPCSYVPTRMLGMAETGAMWDRVALTDFQPVVVDALKVIDSRIDGIVFVEQGDMRPNTRRPSSIGRRTALIKMTDSKLRVPLASSGDGVLRLLQIILSLYAAKGGVLLIDEFENGLHYSVQEKIWDAIFYHAGKLNVQVFSTTHSSDTVRAFSTIANESGVGSLIQLSKSAAVNEDKKTIATVYNNYELRFASETDVELR
jgi:hypothetical protein